MADADPEAHRSYDPTSFGGPADWANMYRAHGIQVVPGMLPSEAKPGESWKRPVVPWKGPEFQGELVPPLTWDRWYGEGGAYVRRYQMGMITGAASGDVCMVDLDDHKTDAAKFWWLHLLHTFNGGDEPETWQQITGGGGRHLFFRTPQGWRAPTNRTPLGVDIRGQGGFAVLPPSIHDSGRQYRWKPGHEPWTLIDGPARAPDWLLEAIDELVARHGGQGSRAVAVRTQSPELDHDAFGNLIDGRESYMARVVWAAVVDLFRERGPERPSLQETQEAAVAAYLRYELPIKSRLPGTKREALEAEGRGHSAFSAKWNAAMKHWDDRVADDAKSPPPEKPRPTNPPASRMESPAPDHGPGQTNGAAGPAEVGEGERPKLKLHSAFPIDGAKLERRQIIVSGLLIRKHLSVLVAPPGSGKSLFTLQMAIAIAVGMNWGGFIVRAPAKVLVINSEDDIEEMRRRLWAAAKSMKVSQEAIGDKVVLVDAPERVVVARTDARSKAVIRTPLVGDLVEAIKDNAIDVVIADPFAETFEGDENSNSEVKWAGITWRDIGRRTGTALLLVHHTKKYAGGMAGDADASRGGGALIGTARVVATLFAMTEEEAQVLSVPDEERASYVRFDSAKANMSLITKAARWFHKQAVILPNGSSLLPGDEVGVLVPWKCPGTFDGISIDLIGRVLNTIDRGMLDHDGVPMNKPYTHASTSTDKSRWAGAVIAAQFGCDHERAKRVMKEWLESGLLIVFEFQDGKQVRKGLKVDPTKRPDFGGS